MTVWVIVLGAFLVWYFWMPIKKGGVRLSWGKNNAFIYCFYPPIRDAISAMLASRAKSGHKNGWVSEIDIVDHVEELPQKWRFTPTVSEVERALLLMRTKNLVQYDPFLKPEHGGSYKIAK